MSGAESARRRDAAATREGILEAAVVEFTEHGYARAGVRQIAEQAGVTAMMINRYFGSKEGLFAEAVDRSFSPPTVVGDEPGDLANAIARSLAERTAVGAVRLDPFLLMLRSAADPIAGPIIRRGIEAHVGARFTQLLSGCDADIRAELGLALVSGTWLLRAVVGTGALATVDNEHLAALLTRMLAPITHDPDVGLPAERQGS